MTITAETLLTDLRELLNDLSEEVWSADLKIALVNEALNMIALIRPDAFSILENYSLTIGTPKQNIPETGIRFLDVIMNINGKPVRKIRREELNETVTNWTTLTDTEIEFYAFDEESPTTFWVFPVPAAAIEVELAYVITPTTFTGASESLGVPDIYIAPIKDYVLSRCYDTETEGRNTRKSEIHTALFYKALGVKFESDSVLKQVQEG